MPYAALGSLALSVQLTPSVVVRIASSPTATHVVAETQETPFNPNLAEVLTV
jgi:hypothetical protein